MALVAQAYKYYRLLFKGSFATDNKYASFAELRLFEDSLGEGTNLCIGAIATSKGRYSDSGNASNAIDGNEATFYESESTNFSGGSTTWFMIELPEAKIVRSYYISPNKSYPAEFPVNFILQGSNDKNIWTSIFENLSVPGAVAYTRTIASYVGGISRLTNGQPTQRILITNWSTGAYITSATPDLSGNWFASIPYGTDVLVTHIGPAGYKPESDGPITPYLW